MVKKASRKTTKEKARPAKKKKDRCEEAEKKLREKQYWKTGENL